MYVYIGTSRAVLVVVWVVLRPACLYHVWGTVYAFKVELIGL